MQTYYKQENIHIISNLKNGTYTASPSTRTSQFSVFFPTVSGLLLAYEFKNEFFQEITFMHKFACNLKVLSVLSLYRFAKVEIKLLLSLKLLSHGTPFSFRVSVIFS